MSFKGSCSQSVSERTYMSCIAALGHFDLISTRHRSNPICRYRSSVFFSAWIMYDICWPTITTKIYKKSSTCRWIYQSHGCYGINNSSSGAKWIQRTERTRLSWTSPVGPSGEDSVRIRDPAHDGYENGWYCSQLCFHRNFCWYEGERITLTSAILYNHDMIIPVLFTAFSTLGLEKSSPWRIDKVFSIQLIQWKNVKTCASYVEMLKGRGMQTFPTWMDIPTFHDNSQVV